MRTPITCTLIFRFLFRMLFWSKPGDRHTCIQRMRSNKPSDRQIWSMINYIRCVKPYKNSVAGEITRMQIFINYTNQIHTKTYTISFGILSSLAEWTKEKRNFIWINGLHLFQTVYFVCHLRRSFGHIHSNYKMHQHHHQFVELNRIQPLMYVYEHDQNDLAVLSTHNGQNN